MKIMLCNYLYTYLKKNKKSWIIY